MLKKYKNEIYQLLSDTEYGIGRFEWTENDNDTIITLKGSPFQYFINQSSDSYSRFEVRSTNFAPGYPVEEFHTMLTTASFVEVTNNLLFWLNSNVMLYLEETEGLDLWEQYNSGNKLLNLDKIDFDDKTNFSTNEQKQIALAVEDLKLLVAGKFEMSDGQHEAVMARLDYLAESVARLNRFDWKSLLISTIMSISIALSLDTAMGTELLNLFKQVFNVIPQLLIQTPSPPVT